MRVARHKPPQTFAELLALKTQRVVDLSEWMWHAPPDQPPPMVEPARPVHEITVAGNLRQMYRGIVALGDELKADAIETVAGFREAGLRKYKPALVGPDGSEKISAIPVTIFVFR